jgi:neutral ceramidase
MEPLHASAAQAVITPPLGIDLTGFGGRPGPASTVHDDLYVRALVLAQGEARVAIVTLDVLGLAPELVATIRSLVASRTGVPASHLLLNCSHTHAGPATMTLRGLGERDAAYEDVLGRTVAGAVAMAADRLEPARLALGRGAAHVGINRRQRLADGRTVLGENPMGTYDPSVPVLRVDGADGRPIAVAFSHATHPVILGSENTGLSADLPGPAVAFVRQSRVGGAAEAMPLFMQGCCGDINPTERGSHEAVRGLGTRLGAAAVIGAESAEPLEGAPLAARGDPLPLPLQPPPSPKECRALRDAEAARLREAESRAPAGGEYALRPPRAMVEWAADLLRLSESPEPPRTVPLELQCLRIGDLAVVAMAGEAFIDLGRAIVARSPAPHTLVLGYSNGLIGYLPTAASFPLGGYEVDTAYRYFGTLMVTDACESLIVEEAARRLKELWGERGGEAGPTARR